LDSKRQFFSVFILKQGMLKTNTVLMEVRKLKKEVRHALDTSGFFVAMLIVSAIKLIVFKTNEQALIAELGYTKYGVLESIAAILLLVWLELVILRFYYALSFYTKEKKLEREHKTIADLITRECGQEDCLDTPDKVYAYLNIQQYNFLSSEKGQWIKKIVGQLNETNQLRDEFMRLLATRRDIQQPSETEDSLQIIGVTIYMWNAKRLINYCVVGGDRLFLNNVADVYEENSILLKQAREILKGCIE